MSNSSNEFLDRHAALFGHDTELTWALEGPERRRLAGGVGRHIDLDFALLCPFVPWAVLYLGEGDFWITITGRLPEWSLVGAGGEKTRVIANGSLFPIPAAFQALSVEFTDE